MVDVVLGDEHVGHHAAVLLVAVGEVEHGEGVAVVGDRVDIPGSVEISLSASTCMALNVRDISLLSVHQVDGASFVLLIFKDVAGHEACHLGCEGLEDVQNHRGVDKDEEVFSHSETERILLRSLLIK